MGTTQPRRRRRSRDSDADGDGQAEAPPKVTGAMVAKRVREELAAMTGLSAESVTALKRNEDGGWTVTIEMLELSRIPETDDVLGSYEVDTDADGELEGYRRLARYPRSYQYENKGGS
jgi:hypothetical protein